MKILRILASLESQSGSVSSAPSLAHFEWTIQSFFPGSPEAMLFEVDSSEESCTALIARTLLIIYESQSNIC